MRRSAVTASLGLLLGLAACSPMPAQAPMSFFVTGTPGPSGANFGGLAGADRHCQQLAAAAGAGGRTWHAYLSTNAAGGGAAVNARDRIGTGPWRNAKGDVIARNVDELHGDNNLNKQTALTEKGAVVSGRGDPVNQHDILTGSLPDGRAAEQTCGNWTMGGADGAAMVGHHDRMGLNDQPPAKSWNSSHPSRGCSGEALKTTGGAGYLYCFATN